MMNNSKRLPAEWEEDCAVLVAWPHSATDWNYMLPQAEECYDNLVRAIARHAKVVIVAPEATALRPRFADIHADRIIYFNAPTNDTWIRDYGPITTVDSEGNFVANDFGFNAWGGKFNYTLDNAVTAQMSAKGLISASFADHNDFIMEGGSIESDGKGTLLTTTSCLLTPTRNPHMSREDIENYLKETLGISKVLWLDKGAMIGDDTDGHIDTIARLAPFNTILYNGMDGNPSDPIQSDDLAGMKEALSEMTDAEGNHFNLIELPVPDPIYDSDDGHRLPATYANFLVVNDAIILPVYGQPMNDLRAEMTLRVAFPNHSVEKVDCRPLIRQHGSLHCATMQIPVAALSV